MSTLLTQIEAVLNLRPLCPLSDSENISALTSGHFLIDHAPTLVPEPQLETIKVYHLKRWQLIRQMLESFWTDSHQNTYNNFMLCINGTKSFLPCGKDL